MRDTRETNLGVTHGGRCVAVYRAEVALSVYQRITQRKRLRHTHDGVVNGGVTVRVIFTHHVTDDTGRFFVRFVPVNTLLTHCVNHTTMDGLQPVSHIGQCAANDYAHGVIKIRLAHLFFEIGRYGFFSEGFH